MGIGFQKRWLAIASCSLCALSVLPLFLVPIAATGNRSYTIVPVMGILGLVYSIAKESERKKTLLIIAFLLAIGCTGLTFVATHSCFMGACA
jgi:peptidoglycan/LPS O-acetylase OafA/YrhL